MNKKRLVLFLLVFILSALSDVYPHCDTLEGPVVKDAKAALEKKEVTSVLKWVKKEKEPQLRRAFEAALEARSAGANFEKTDRDFFETLIRIHREGEGASFTGLKPEGSIGKIESAADQALETGSVEGLTAEISQHLKNGIKERFDRVIEKRKTMNEGVGSGREYVEAYVEYLHYVEGIHQSIENKGEQH